MTLDESIEILQKYFSADGCGDPEILIESPESTDTFVKLYRAITVFYDHMTDVCRK